MNSTGKILDIEIPQSIRDTLAGTGMADLIETSSKNATLAFPAEPLKLEDHWTVDTESETPAGKVTIKSTYTYKGTVTKNNKELHHFDVDIEMAFGENPMGATIEITEQEANGALYFDAEAGRIDHSEVDQDVKMTISAGGMTMNQVLKQDVKLTFKEVE